MVQYRYYGMFDLSDRFNVQTLPTPVPTLISNVIADTFCVGEEVIFTAGSNLLKFLEFFVNGNSYQNITTIPLIHKI